MTLESNPKALIVDDDPKLGKLTATVISPLFSPLVATSGPEGLELFLEHRPRLVLLDRDMPEMTGEVVAERIRGITNNPEDPYILMISGRAAALNIEDLRKRGVNELISKPWRDTELLDKLVQINQRFQPPA